jgi:hypothetical protein
MCKVVPIDQPTIRRLKASMAKKLSAMALA